MTSSSYNRLISNKGFQAFLWTQFLGAFNDNVFKIIVSLVAIQMAAEKGKWLALAGAVFVIPFLLFAGWSGQLAAMRPTDYFVAINRAIPTTVITDPALPLTVLGFHLAAGLIFDWDSSTEL